MRSLFIGIIVLSASMAVVQAGQAQRYPKGPPGYEDVQTPKGAQQPVTDDLRSIERDNQDLDLPASPDDLVGADQVHSEEEAHTKRIDQDSVRIDREIRNICPSC
jgi:hypothetical protein